MPRPAILTAFASLILVLVLPAGAQNILIAPPGGDWDGWDNERLIVPEPVTALAITAGLPALAGYLRRRSQTVT
ncbi:MAG: PEP-CTERM sorting domain-containing protein [Phycisphaerae bacterium]